jgi:ASC-1-like (ASCH) protein
MSIMTDEVQVTHINVQSPWFECIVFGSKTVEGRVYVKPYSSLKMGSVIMIHHVDKDRHELNSTPIKVRVSAPLRRYRTIDDFLNFEMTNALPGITDPEVGRALYSGLLKQRAQEIQEFGMIAIPIE